VFARSINKFEHIRRKIMREETMEYLCECGKEHHLPEANYCGNCGKKIENADCESASSGK